VAVLDTDTNGRKFKRETETDRDGNFKIACPRITTVKGGCC